MPESNKPSLGESNYRDFAQRYAEYSETKPHNAFYERPATLSLLPALDGLTVLDAGCGPGFYAEWLVTHGAAVSAFDVTPDMVEITRQRVGDRAEVFIHDLEAPLAFAHDAQFDLVLCPLVLDYVEDWGVVFREFARVLKPGGYLVYSCGHPASDFYRFHPEGSYFTITLYEMLWGGFGEPRVPIRSYRRPLGAMLNPMLAVGLQLDTLLEPRPTRDYHEADPKGYADYMQHPGFICIRARKGTEA